MKNKYIKLSLLYFILGVISQLLAIFSYPVIASILDPDDLPKYNQFHIFLNLMIHGYLFGLMSAALKSDTAIDKHVEVEIIIMIFCQAVVIMILFNLIQNFFSWMEAIALSFVCLLLSLGHYISQIYLKYQMPLKNKAFFILLNGCLISYIFAINQTEAIEFLDILTCYLAFSALILFFLFPFNFHFSLNIERTNLARHFRTSLPIGLYTFFGLYLEYLLRENVMRQITSTEFIYFNTYLLIVLNCGMVTQALNNALIPDLLKNSAKLKYIPTYLVISSFCFLVLQFTITYLPNFFPLEMLVSLLEVQQTYPSLLLFAFGTTTIWQICNNTTLIITKNEFLVYSVVTTIILIMLARDTLDINTIFILSIVTQILVVSLLLLVQKVQEWRVLITLSLLMILFYQANSSTTFFLTLVVFFSLREYYLRRVK